MKYVEENLNKFNEYKFFNNLLNEEDFHEKEDEEGMSDAEKKKLINQIAKDGKSIIKKLQLNFKQFKQAAGDKWQEYRDFWTTQEEADQSIGQKGIFYNLYNSDYIVGVVANASGNAELKIYNMSQKDTDEYETFVCKNPDVILAFNDFFKGEVQQTMKNIISSHKEAMAGKKEADKIKAKDEKTAVKRAKLDAFLGESVLNEERNWAIKIDITDAVQNASEHGDWQKYKEELADALDLQLEEVNNVLGDEVAMQLEDIIEELRQNVEDEDGLEWILSELLLPWAEDNDIFLAQYGEADMEPSREDLPGDVTVSHGEKGTWTDPAGGTHYDDDEDPAAAYI